MRSIDSIALQIAPEGTAVPDLLTVDMDANGVSLLAREGFFPVLRNVDPQKSTEIMERRNYQIRLAGKEKDMEALVMLEKKCWAENLQNSRQVILSRLEKYPEGQWIAVYMGKVVGVMYTQPIKDRECLLSGGTNYANQSEQCLSRSTEKEPSTSTGRTLQLLGVAVLGEYAHLQLGDALRDHVLLNAKLKGFADVVAMTRCSAYSSTNNTAKKGDFEAYEGYVKAHLDPTLLFHENKGAKVVQVAKGYRPEDESNQGHAVLITYEGVVRSDEDSANKPNTTNTAAESSEVVKFLDESALQALVKEVLGSAAPRTNINATNAAQSFLDAPFMAQGLDSLSMMTLTGRLAVLVRVLVNFRGLHFHFMIIMFTTEWFV